MVLKMFQQEVQNEQACCVGVVLCVHAPLAPVRLPLIGMSGDVCSSGQQDNREAASAKTASTCREYHERPCPDGMTKA